MSPTMTGATLLLLLSCAFLQPLKGFIVILHPVEKWQHTHCALPKENSNDEISPSSNATKPDEPSSISLEWVEYYGPQNSRHSTPVLFLHGLLGSKRNFESLGKMLGTQLEEKRRILGVDLR
jgi:pimeloyl-ACP methyl ester carboxylesterase